MFEIEYALKAFREECGQLKEKAAGTEDDGILQARKLKPQVHQEPSQSLTVPSTMVQIGPFIPHG